MFGTRKGIISSIQKIRKFRLTVTELGRPLRTVHLSVPFFYYDNNVMDEIFSREHKKKLNHLEWMIKIGKNNNPQSLSSLGLHSKKIIEMKKILVCNY